MDWAEILSEIFKVCIIPLLGVLTAYLVKYINVQKEKIKAQTENELIDKYIDQLADTISVCVIATNQTYVEALKKEGKFDKEAQLKAFDKTKNAVLATLTEESKKYLALAYGDLNKYINTQIEAQVNINKYQIEA